MSRRVRAELTCEDVGHILDLYLDGEVDEIERREIEMHLIDCADCAELEAKHRHTRERLRALAGGTRATDEFRARLTEAFEQEISQRTEAETHIQTVRKDRRRHWAYAATALAAGLLVALPIVLNQPAGDAAGATPGNEVLGMTSVRSPVIEEAIAWHQRSVPVEVTGPDPAHVLSWFEDEGMVDFDMVIPDLGRRATLLGGRLSHVRYHEAGYLLYEVGGEKITVLMFHQDPAENEDLQQLEDQDGLLVDNHSGQSVVLTTHGELTYTFTSDMGSDRLSQLVERAFPAGQ